MPKFTLVQVYFPYTGNGKDYEKEFLQKKILFEISATLPTPQKASGSVLKCMWSFDSNKHFLNQLPIVA